LFPTKHFGVTALLTKLPATRAERITWPLDSATPECLADELNIEPAGAQSEQAAFGGRRRCGQRCDRAAVRRRGYRSGASPRFLSRHSAPSGRRHANRRRSSLFASRIVVSWPFHGVTPILTFNLGGARIGRGNTVSNSWTIEIRLTKDADGAGAVVTRTCGDRMNLIREVATTSVLAIAVGLFAALSLARELGYWIGCRFAGGREGQAEGVGVVVGAILGLQAFVLALTLSFATTRFTERRAGTLAEANAIGTAWLRAEAIGHPRAIAIARLLEDYARTRADFVRASGDPAELEILDQRTQALQTEIWGHLTAIVRERPDAISSALQASLNETFDTSATERFAYAFRLPPQLFRLLIGMALLCMTALGVQFSLKGHPTRILATLLAFLWAIVIVDILDLAAARLGALRTSAEVYEWTIQGLGKDVAIPPMPAGH
jgi:hypothetical protein